MSVCVLLVVGQSTRQSEQTGSEVRRWSVSRTEAGNQRDVHRHCRSQGCVVILTRNTAKNRSAACRETIMTVMQNDEMLARRVQAAEDRKRDHVRTLRMSEMQSDPEHSKNMMLRTISSVQSQAVAGTDINQVPLICRWKARHYRRLRKDRIDLLRQFCNLTLTQNHGVPMNQCQSRQRHGHERHCDE